MNGKLVFEGADGLIYRIGSKDEINLRQAARKAATLWGIKAPLFCEEKIIEENGYFVLSVQQKLRELKIEDLPMGDLPSIDCMGKNEIAKKITNRIFNDYPSLDYEKTKKFFEDLRIGWFGVHNVGIDKNDKIQIFDFVGNFAYNPTTDILIYMNEEGQHELRLGGV